MAACKLFGTLEANTMVQRLPGDERMKLCCVAPGFGFLLKMLRDGNIPLAYADADSDTVFG